VPIVHEDRVTGVLHVGNGEPRRFDEEDLSLLEIVASRLAPAIENARLHEAEREARLAAEADAARLRLSQSLVEALGGILSLEEAARRILDHRPELGASPAASRSPARGRRRSHPRLDGLSARDAAATDDDPPPEVAVRSRKRSRRVALVHLLLPERDAAYPALAGLASVGGSWVALPLVVDGAARGALTLSFPGSRSFDDPDRRLMTMLAHQCSQALDRSTIYERERQMRADVEATGRRLSLLQSLTAAFSEALTGDRIARIVVTKATAAIGADSGVLLLLDEDGSSLEIRSAFGYPDEALAGWERFPVSLATPAGDAVREGRLVVISSPEEMVERYPLMASSVTGRPMGPTAVVPILVGERALGVVSFSFPPHHVLRPSDHGLLSALGSHAGQALERARLFETELVARREAEQERSRTEHLQAVTEALIDLESPAAVLDVLVDQSLVALGAVGALVVRATGDRGLELAAARGYPAEVTAPLRRFGLEDGARSLRPRERAGRVDLVRRGGCSGPAARGGRAPAGGTPGVRRAAADGGRSPARCARPAVRRTARMGRGRSRIHPRDRPAVCAGVVPGAPA
jgi:GAF domain-containing protein